MTKETKKPITKIKGKPITELSVKQLEFLLGVYEDKKIMYRNKIRYHTEQALFAKEDIDFCDSMVEAVYGELNTRKENNI